MVEDQTSPQETILQTMVEGRMSHLRTVGDQMSLLKTILQISRLATTSLQETTQVKTNLPKTILQRTTSRRATTLLKIASRHEIINHLGITSLHEIIRRRIMSRHETITPQVANHRGTTTHRTANHQPRNRRAGISNRGTVVVGPSHRRIAAVMVGSRGVSLQVGEMREVMMLRYGSGLS